MKFKPSTRYPFLFLLLQLALQNMSFAQSDSAALAAADTSRFSVNANGGWLLYNSYVSEYGADSVQLEVIIRHTNDVNWNEEQYFGKVKDEALSPQIGQTLIYQILQNAYAVRIEPNGKCYLRLLSGMPPFENPAVIPVRLRYKR